MRQLESDYRHKEKIIFALAAIIVVLAIAFCVVFVAKFPRGPGAL
jgi:succinate dehydrogenase hydrophobic anchor subunit